MPAGHLISRVTILGTGLIGGSFGLALRKYTAEMHLTGWDRPDIVREAQNRGALDEAFCGELAPALQSSDLIYLALPIAATIDLLPEIARHAPSHALVTDACSTKVRIAQAAAELFPTEQGPLFLGGHPMAGRELPGIAHADADLFRENTYALIAQSSEAVAAGRNLSRPSQETSSQRDEPGDTHDPRVSAFVRILEKIGARSLWVGAPQHDYAVGLASHLPQLAAVALASFLYDRLDENGLPITLAASTNFAKNSPLANSKPTSTPPTNSTNSCVLSSANQFLPARELPVFSPLLPPLDPPASVVAPKPAKISRFLHAHYADFPYADRRHRHRRWEHENPDHHYEHPSPGALIHSTRIFQPQRKMK